MARQLESMPAAELDSRPSDVPLSPEQFLKFAVFAQLKNKPTVEKFPGTIVLRHYRKGEAICRQGEAGWTAFYILTTEDTLELLESRLKAAMEKGGREQLSVNEELTRLAVRAAKSPVSNSEVDRRRAATAFLTLARPAHKKNLGAGWRGDSRKMTLKLRSRDSKRLVPIDAPQDIDYDTQQAPVFEGDIFGEMSCLYRTQRSATILADEDCYVLEFLRNILDQFQKDPAYKARMDAIYRKRVLELHLQNLPIFETLTEEQIESLRETVELLTFTGGDVIFDENDRSDSMYVIRSGVVKVKKFVSELLAVSDVNDWASSLRNAPTAAVQGQETYSGNSSPNRRRHDRGNEHFLRAPPGGAGTQRYHQGAQLLEAELVKALLVATVSEQGERTADKRQTLRSRNGTCPIRSRAAQSNPGRILLPVCARDAGDQTVLSYLSR